MNRKRPTYVRTRRREWGLTQVELARILGCQSREHVSRIENNKGMPRLELAIACEVLFAHSLESLFPDLYKQIRRDIGDSLEELHKSLGPQSTVRGVRKRFLIKTAIDRITS